MLLRVLLLSFGSEVWTSWASGWPPVVATLAALTMTVAKRPEALILDEPVASLDPPARREFLQDRMEAVAEQGLSVVLSSHLISDLERVCDYLILLVASRVVVAGPVEELLATHHLLTGPRREPDTLPIGQHVISASHTDRQTTLLVRTSDEILDPAWTVAECMQGLQIGKANHMSMLDCLTSNGIRVAVTYQPASRYWALQGAENAIYGALAFVLAGYGIWRIRRRTSMKNRATITRSVRTGNAVAG